MTNLQKAAIILNSPNDWEVWIDMIRNRAKIAKVWQFMDLSIKAEDLPILSRPTLPLPRDVNPAKALVSDLTEAEMEELKTLRNDRKDRNREYEKQQSAIESLHTLVHETVSRSYYTYLIKKDTLHEMLTALKQRVAPSDQARELELISQYQKLKKAPRNQNLDNWLKQWETTYTDCRELSLPDVAKTRALYDFLNAIQEKATDFAGIWIVRIQEREQTGEDIPDLYKILKYFRNHMRVRNAQKDQVSHGAFVSSFKDQKLDSGNPGKDKNDRKEKKKRPCLCGKLHRFGACWYLMETLRPADWKPDPSIQQQINEKLQEHPRLREAVERIRKQVKSKGKDDAQLSNLAALLSQRSATKPQTTSYETALSLIPERVYMSVTIGQGSRPSNLP